MVVRLIAIGFISILGQVVLLRELNVAFFGSELVYILALGVWMFWTAVGAAAGRRSAIPGPGRVRVLLIALGAVIPMMVVFARGLRLIFGAVPGAYLPFTRQMAAMALCLLPVSLALGFLFQWAAKQYVADGGRQVGASRGTLAAAYAIECVGAMAGGIVATLSLRWGVQNLAAALLCGALSAAAGGYGGRAAGGEVSASRRRRALSLAAAGLAAFLLSCLAWGTALDAGLSSWNHPDLVATRDTPYGRVTVAEASGQITVFENDAIAFDTEAATAEEFAHLAALQRAAPKSVLVLGGGAGGLVAELLRHRPDRIDYVELDKTFLDLVVPRLPESYRGALEAEPVEVRIADPRRFLEAAGAYDLILVGMPEPGSGQANRFYTREFFALCREHLGPRGVLALRLRGAENVWTPHLARRTSSIHAALSAVFDDVVILPGSINIMLASPAPLGRDPSLLAGRLAARGIEGKLVIAPYLDYLYTSDRFTEIADLVRRTRAPVNSDVHPICYQYTLLIWLSLFLPDLMLLGLPVVEASEVVRAPLFWIGGLAVAGLFLLSRRRSIVRRALLAGVAGFAGMVLETILILHYQTRSGVLFQDLGLLLTLFMAGMAVGAAATDALMRRSARWAAAGRLPGVVALAAMVGLGVAVAKLLEAGRLETLASTGPALAAVGFLVAALFAYASLQRQPDQRTVIAPLYSADLLGGSVGSIAATLFLIPVIGLVGAVTLTLAFVVIALFLT